MYQLHGFLIRALLLRCCPGSVSRKSIPDSLLKQSLVLPGPFLFLFSYTDPSWTCGKVRCKRTSIYIDNVNSIYIDRSDNLWCVTLRLWKMKKVEDTFLFLFLDGLLGRLHVNRHMHVYVHPSIDLHSLSAPWPWCKRIWVNICNNSAIAVYTDLTRITRAIMKKDGL